MVATAFGLGLHSFHLLLHTLNGMSNINPYLLEKLQRLPQGHVHGEEIVDARAMYFAAISMLVKEILYRITFKVAEEQHSNVLMANAMHHRSDAFGSLVALLAIVGLKIPYHNTLRLADIWLCFLGRFLVRIPNSRSSWRAAGQWNDFKKWVRGWVSSVEGISW